MLYLKCTKVTRFSDTKCIAVNSNTNSQVRYVSIYVHIQINAMFENELFSSAILCLKNSVIIL